MKQINRYLMLSILQTTLIVLLAFLGMRLVISLLGEMPQIKDSYTVVQAVLFSFSTLPVNLYVLFPPIALLGTLLALGNLASSSELTIMRSSGLSMAQLTWLVLKAALIMTLLVSLLGETVGTNLAMSSEMRKAGDLSGGQILTTQYGIWLREGNDFFHIGSKPRSNYIADITRYAFDSQNKLTSISHAKDAHYIDDQWHFSTIKTSVIGDFKVLTNTKNQIIWPLSLQADHWLKGVEAYEIPLPMLYKRIQYLKKNGLNTGTLSLSFWSRLFQPLTTLIMVLLAIPFVFGPLRSVSMGLRLLSGVLVGLGFYVFDRLFIPFSVVYQLPPIIAALVPAMLFSLAGLWLMWRTF